MFATFSFKKQSLTKPPRNYLPRREKTPWIVRLCRCERRAEPQVSLFQYSEKWWSLYFTIQYSTRSHTYSAKVPWSKSLNLMCPIKYICNAQTFKGSPLAESALKTPGFTFSRSPTARPGKWWWQRKTMKFSVWAFRDRFSGRGLCETWGV